MIGDITKKILEKTKRLSVVPEITEGDHGFHMFNDAGTEVEVSEFLYSFVCMLKPQFIFETGCHKGISAAFMGQALKDVGRGGKLQTCEIFQEHIDDARDLWKDLELDNVTVHQKESLTFEWSNNSIDLLFLDSEPWLRFDEFIKFWDAVRPGGFILIHDIDQALGNSGITERGEYNWPWGTWMKKLGPFINEHKVQTIHFPTPRGFTLFQKTAPDFQVTQFLNGKLS